MAAWDIRSILTFRTFIRRRSISFTHCRCWLSQISGWPIIAWFNFIVSAMAVLSGMLFGFAAPSNYRLASGAFWTAFLLLAAHDYFFGQREYFFVMAWVPYLYCRCGIGRPPIGSRSPAALFWVF